MKRRAIRSPLVAAAVAGTSLLAAATVAAPPSADAATGGLQVNQVWSVSIPDGSSPIAQSSPIVGTLDSAGQSVLVGDRSGRVYALHLSDGSEVRGWPVDVGVPVDSAPSTDGPAVFVGAGNATNSARGGYYAYSATGTRLWYQAPPAAPGSSATVGVDSGLAVGDLQGVTGVVSGAMGQMQDALNASNGAVLGGWPFFEADTNFTTPALADLYSNGGTEIVEGGDSSPGIAFGKTYPAGGHIRVLSTSGALQCSYDTNQVVQSSPAVGRFLGGGATGIVAGTGTYWPNASNTDQLIAVNPHCGLAWASTLDGETVSSPALVDAQGNGSLQVAEGTAYGPAGAPMANGSVYLLNGANGQVIWRTPALGGIIGGVVSADLGGGYQDIVAATTGGVEILDGRTGAVLWTGLHGALAFQNAPLVTTDANGTVGITVAGYNGSGSEVVHYEVAGSPGSRVDEAGAWPMFHRDDHLTGDAGTPPPAPVTVPCKPPAGTPSGYWLDASDGGIFAYGNLPFCGSTGSVALNRPVVGMAGTPDGGGYWLVASDGGIFSFGDARFYGSTGNVALHKPIVGMARTPDGKGYWLVASDGGIFSFGDARFYGSTGNVALHQPVVGMAATPSGNGYWLVASDGGIFSYGDARFYGSTGAVRLNRPVVGMAATRDGNGYWLVASDGGIFAYGDARFHGSTGNVALNRPVVGMAGY